MSAYQTLARHESAVRAGAASLRAWVAENEARALAAAAYVVFLLVMLLLVLSATAGDNGAPASDPRDAKRTAAAPAGDRKTKARPLKKARDRLAAPSRTAGEPSSAGAEQEEETYRVESGDTLSTIAARFGTTVDDLLALNPGIDPYMLNRGQEVRVR